MGDRIHQIAAILFSLMFVAILALVNSNVLLTSRSVNDQIARTYAQTEMRELETFNENTVTGATVISAIKNYDNLYSSDMLITVVNSGNTSSYGSNGEAYTAALNTDPKYIDPAKSYTASLVRNANKVVTGIRFTVVP